MSNGAKILFYDLETSPNLVYTWGIYEQTALEVVKPWEILSVAYKYLGEKTTKVITREDFSDKTDKSLMQELWKLLNSADLIVAHNGIQFDNKKSNTRFLKHGLQPAKPYKTIDTLKVARKHFAFNSNRLDELGKFLEVGRKVRTGGKDLWLDCLKGDAKAWKLMKKYNKQDVVLLEQVYLKLRPWMENHPNVAALQENPDGCPSCGSSEVFEKGEQVTGASVKFQYRCSSCGHWFSRPKSRRIFKD